MSETDPSDARRDLAGRIVSLIDLTDLSDDHAPDGIDALISRAAEHGTAAVCVWPEYVARCAAALRATPVAVATVIDFPGGGSTADDVVAEIATALDDGADEVDLVLPYAALAAGDDDDARRNVVAAVGAVRAVPGRHLKVILETGELGDPALIRRAAELAIDAGADFIKTSTGKTPVGATIEAFEVMVDVVATCGRPVGLKPSGGIRTVDEAAAYLAVADGRLGATHVDARTFRFGASGLLDAALEALR